MYIQHGNEMNLQQFYPEELMIKHVINDEKGITLQMSAKTKRECICPKCKMVSSHVHGTYNRKIQDLPILGQTTWLHVSAYEYECDNPDCNVKTFAENVSGFLDYYSRMTNRCKDLICSLALETSCEGCARICKNMNIKISGDTVIRLLLRRYEAQERLKCGSVIGIDDFAFKKRTNYGTIIVDGKTHETVEILDGRDGNTLKEWLKNNKHVKIVTRDRASAYASAIQEILPDAMQVADRFHLHQNLLEAVKQIINGTIPNDIKIPIQEKDINIENNGSTEECVSKKNR